MPSAPTFSRAFTAFAQEQWPQQIHAEGIRRQVGPKLVGHVSRGATRRVGRSASRKVGKRAVEA